MEAEGASKAAMARATGLSPPTTKEEKSEQVFSMWLACYTQQEIADAVGWSRVAVTEEIGTFIGFADSGKIDKSARNAANHETDFEPPIYIQAVKNGGAGLSRPSRRSWERLMQNRSSVAAQFAWHSSSAILFAVRLSMMQTHE